MSKRAIAILAALVALPACYRTAPPPAQPDPRVVELEKRVDKLEQTTEQLGVLATRLDQLARAMGQIGQLGEKIAELPEGPRTKIETTDELDLRLAEIDDKLNEIERKIATGRAGARPPSRPARPPGPNPATTYSVPVAGAPSVGPRTAKVTIVKGFEFACPFCERTRATLEQLQKDYGKDLRIVYKHFIVHPSTATIPAQAACAAHQQGKFKEMYELIWDKGFKAGRDLSQANMEKLATELGLDIGQLQADMNGRCAKVVRDDQATLSKLGMRGTPGFFINGRFLSGARPIDQFKVVIDEELAKANKRIRKGTRQRDYYNTWVVLKGKKSL